MSKLDTVTSQVRIIAGRWRGRKITFTTDLSIRPTPDRVRETVFNWLAPYLVKRCCLDLYAGSGVLGFEALSRGASEVVFIDNERTVIKNLEAQHQTLKIDTEISKDCAQYINSDALIYLLSIKTKFDLIFLDPPYHQNMIQPIIDRIAEINLMNSDCLIYIEMAKDEHEPTLPINWKIIKNKVMGQVVCYLVNVN